MFVGNEPKHKERKLKVPESPMVLFFFSNNKVDQ